MHKTSNMQPDLVEGWVWCRRAFSLGDAPPPPPAELWPDAADEPFFRRLVAEHLPLVQPLARAMLEAIGVQPTLLDARLQARPRARPHPLHRRVAILISWPALLRRSGAGLRAAAQLLPAHPRRRAGGRRAHAGA